MTAREVSFGVVSREKREDATCDGGFSGIADGVVLLAITHGDSAPLPTGMLMHNIARSGRPLTAEQLFWAWLQMTGELAKSEGLLPAQREYIYNLFAGASLKPEGL